MFDNLNDGQTPLNTPTLRVLAGDCRKVLRELETESVQCCVTSPPYWGLPDYKVPASVWRGDEGCVHQWGEIERGKRKDILPEDQTTLKSRTGSDDRQNGAATNGGKFCQKCEAWLGAHGLEPTPELYVRHETLVFREVRRVLRKDGTLWLNLGDSYAGSWGNYHPNSPPGKHGQRLKETARWNRPAYDSQKFLPPTATVKGLKPKDLVGIPWMVAFALRADGWWLRQDIIWAKPNPMPESVTDRCTKSHEYIFLLTKSERYFYDAKAIMEESVTNDLRRPYGSKGAWELDGRPDEQKHGGEPRRPSGDYGHGAGRNDGDNHPSGGWTENATRNRRSVWTVGTKPYDGTHFATFPAALISPCILAGSRPGDVVLDPFGGSGTTGATALTLGRKAVLIELNPDYAKLIEQRCNVTPGLHLS